MLQSEGAFSDLLAQHLKCWVTLNSTPIGHCCTPPQTSSDWLLALAQYLFLEVSYFCRGLIPQLVGNVHHHLYPFVYQVVQRFKGF